MTDLPVKTAGEPKAAIAQPVFWRSVSSMVLVSMTILAILIIAMGLIASFQVRDILSIVDETLMHGEARYLSTRARVESVLLSDLTREYVLRGQPEQKRRVRMLFNESMRRIDEYFIQALKTFPSEERAAVANVREGIQPFFIQALALMNTNDREGQYGPLTHAAMQELAVRRAPLLDYVRSLEDIETAGLDHSRKEAKRVAARAQWMILAGGGLILILAVIIGAINIRRILIPLADIYRGLESVARGQYNVPIQIRRADEFGELALTFNTMAAELNDLIGNLERRVKERTEALSQSNQKLQQEISERQTAQENLKKAYSDLKATQDQLMQSEKMASIGQLAAGVAHEINNPIGFVKSNLHTLKQYADNLNVVMDKYKKLAQSLNMAPNESQKRILDEISAYENEINLEYILSDIPKLVEESYAGSERIRKIVADLRTFSHFGEWEREEADIHELLETVLSIAWNELKYKADVVKRYSDVPRIMCYPQQLSQIFLNILINAAQSIDQKGTITITTYAKEKYMFVEITDTGCGMPPEIIPRIFDPFFTTKPVGKGTGLGLSLAYNIVEKHQGQIMVKSIVGQGSTFTVKLPIEVK